MPDGKPSQTIDDVAVIDEKIPSFIKRLKNGTYEGTGKLWEYHTEPGYVLAWFSAGNNFFYAIREEPSYFQDESVRADLATNICMLKNASKHGLTVRVMGSLLPKEFSVGKHFVDNYRGLRMQFCIASRDT